jgi:hypothetical protein
MTQFRFEIAAQAFLTQQLPTQAHSYMLNLNLD